jgi:hypothetical protein
MEFTTKGIAFHLLRETKFALDRHTGYKTGTFTVCVINLKTLEPKISIVHSLDTFLPTLDLSSEEIVVWHRILDFGTNAELATMIHTALMNEIDNLGVFLSDAPNGVQIKPDNMMREEHKTEIHNSREQEALNLLRYRLDPTFEKLPVAKQMLWRSLVKNLLQDASNSAVKEFVGHKFQDT